MVPAPEATWAAAKPQWQSRDLPDPGPICRTATTVPCVLPAASTGTGEVMRVTKFKLFNTWDTHVN